MTNPNLIKAAFADPEAALDELARRDFVSFLIRAFPHLNGGANLATNWHLDAVAYELERVRLGQNRRLMLTMPPRNLKSIMCSIAWVAWMLGHDPTQNFVCVSYSSDLSTQLAFGTRGLMQSTWYKRMYPQTRLHPSRSALHDFQTTAGGGRLSTSVSGTLTGRGGDIIIIDDPIKPEDALSDTVREKVNDWYCSTLASRLNDKGKGAIILVMQRLHPFDLAGVLEGTGDWQTLSLPAIATEDQRIPLTRGRWHWRREGDVLHPARESYQQLMQEKARVGSLIFAAQYQQQPIPAAGNLVKRAWLRSYDENSRPTGGRIIQSWDTATEEGIFNDYSVGITALVQGRQVYILDVWRRKVGFPDLKRMVLAKAQEYGPTELLIEDQSSGRQLLQQLRAENHSRVPFPIACKPESDKVSRLAGVSAMIEGGSLFLPRYADWLEDFRAELLAFPATRRKDQVDALSQLLNRVARFAEQYCGDAADVGPLLYTAGEGFSGLGSEIFNARGPKIIDPWGA